MREAWPPSVRPSPPVFLTCDSIIHVCRSYHESFIGLSKGVTMLVLLPLVYRYALGNRPPNDFLFASAGMALGMGTYVPTYPIVYDMIDALPDSLYIKWLASLKRRLTRPLKT